MKTVIAAFSLLAILVAGVFFNAWKLGNAAVALSVKADQILTQAEKGDDCRASVRSLQAQWDQQRFFFSLVINHTEFDRLEEDMVLAVAAADIHAEEDLYLALASLSDTFQHLGDLTGFKAENLL